MYRGNNSQYFLHIFVDKRSQIHYNLNIQVKLSPCILYIETEDIHMKKIIAVLAIICTFVFSVFSSESATMAFVEGCKAYSVGDWTSAKIMLKKAVTYPEYVNADTYYMLISAQINAGDNKGALEDCNFYLENFPHSLYFSRVSYHKGKILYNLGEYEKAIIALSDFCHQNEKSDLYPYALFYIGESLYEGYRYDDAVAIYDRVVTEFPDFEKAAAASYRMETISQRSREEKLLYLLKQTGEEYLAAKEDYEKQLKQYNSESVALTRQKLQETQIRNEELERQISDLQLEIASLKSENEQKNQQLEERYALDLIEQNNSPKTPDSQIKENSYFEEKKVAEKADKEDLDVPSEVPFDETSEQLKALKAKALEAQRILEEK